MKKFLSLAACLLAAFACTKVESEPTPFSDDGVVEYISIPIVNESLDSKAYYYEEPSFWTYLWEDEDTFNYFYYSGGEYQGVGTADVTKNANSTVVSYAASDLEVGNTIYSYFLQRDLWMNEIENEDPTHVKLIIPSYQVTTKEPEQFKEQIDCSFSLTSVDVLTQSAQGSMSGTQASIPDNVLNFTINGFLPELKSYYKCKCDSDEGGVADFTLNNNGEGSVTVSFDNYPNYTKDQATVVKIYLSGEYSGNSVSVKVKAHRDGTSAATKSGRTSKYSTEIIGSSSAVCYNTTYGDEKPYPIRDAMPCASKGKLITSSLLNYPEDIANSMTMYMLGSAAEFRIYSPTGNYTGETIQKVIFTKTNGNCAGYCYYDIESESLEPTGFEKNIIVSDVSDCDYVVPTTKGDERSVYMILAAGTHDGTIDVVTEASDGQQWNYRFVISGKLFTRANRKPFAVNLESTGATRTPYVEPTEPGGEDPEDPMLTPVDQGTFELVNDYMRSFLADAEEQYTDENRMSVTLVKSTNRTKYGFGGNGDLYQSGTNVKANDKPLPVTLSLDSELNGNTVSITIFNDSAKTDVETTVSGTVSDSKFEIYNLIPERKYYYTVTAGGEDVEIGFFETTGSRRIIKVSDLVYADNANNCRDLGGIPTIDGHQIKFGKIYRGTNIDATTAEEQAILTGYLNIGLDVDLRAATHEKTRNIAKQVITSIGYDSQKYSGGSDLLVGSKVAATFTNIFNTVASGKACYIHCFAGADRTGYICAIIEALCGVSNKEITIDYELTSFSCVDLRDRSGKAKNEAFIADYPTLENFTGSTMKEKAENLLVSYGMDIDDIHAFQNAMVE